MQLANAIGIGAYDASIVAGQKLQPAIETADYRSRGNEAGSFRHAVAGVQVCFCAQSHAQRLFVQRRTAQKNACVLPDNLVAIVFQQIGQNLIHYRNMRNAETQHVIQHAHGVVALVHDERATAQKRAHHDLEAANVAHGQHHLPHTTAFQRQSAVCRGGGTGDAIPRQKRGLRGSRRTRCEHDNARLLAIPRLFAFAGERFELRGMRHRAFRQSGKIGKAVARRIDHQALNRRLLQYVDAGFARGVFQLHDAQLALFVGKTRIQQRQREAAVRRRQGKNHDFGTVVQIARKRSAATVTALGKLLSQSRSSKAGAAIAKRYRARILLHAEKHLTGLAVGHFRQLGNHCRHILYQGISDQGNFGNLSKSGLRFSLKASRPSFASSDV